MSVLTWKCGLYAPLTHNRFITVFGFVFASLLVAPLAWATNGYVPHGFSATSKGMGGAGSAFPQDTLTAFSNPAGMARLDKRLDARLGLFMPNREYKANDDGPLLPFPAYQRAPSTAATMSFSSLRLELTGNWMKRAQWASP